MAEYTSMSSYGWDTKYSNREPKTLFLINNEAPPAGLGNVKYGYTEDTEQLVKSQRNSEGVVIAEKVGRMNGQRLLKFNNLEWPLVDAAGYKWLQEKIALFKVILTYYDARANSYNGGIVSKQFYWGDFSAQPFKFETDPQTGLLIPSYYINVKVNLIDCGDSYLNSPAHNPS